MKHPLKFALLACTIALATAPTSAQTISTYCTYTGSLATDASGNLYVLTESQVKKRTPGGITTVVAGTGTPGFSGDGGPATLAQLANNNFSGITLDAAGNIYFCDGGRIRKINTSGIISTIAGNGASAHTGDGGPATAAGLLLPVGIAIDGAGNIYFGEYDYTIRKIDASGIITTIAGTPNVHGYTGDGGPATAALISAVRGMATDAAGNVYMADFVKRVVRKINTSGIITTVAGGGTSTTEGVPATSASINPNGVRVDAAGNLFIADQLDRVRKVNTAGIITTYAGTGAWGYSGDGGPATAAMLAAPGDVAVDAAGNLFINDIENSVVRRVSSTTGIKESAQPAVQATVYPNPSYGSVTVSANLPQDAGEAIITIANMAGTKVAETTYSTRQHNNGKKITLDNNLPGGLYFVTVSSGTSSATSTFTLNR